MVEDVRATQRILKRAMKIEQEGYQFYLKAALSTPDQKGQDMFNTLAEDEQRHFDLIQKQHNSLTTAGRWVPSPEIQPVNIDLDKPLFPRGREALKKVADGSSDREALLFGLEIETKSYDLYRRAAEAPIDTPGRQMFIFLAGQERSHFDILMMRYDALFGPIAWQS